jgi:hypothetical protein
VGYCTFPTHIHADSYQAFGEISNEAAQFPGGLNDHVKLDNTDWQNGNATG